MIIFGGFWHSTILITVNPQVSVLFVVPAFAGSGDGWQMHREQQGRAGQGPTGGRLFGEARRIGYMYMYRYIVHAL